MNKYIKIAEKFLGQHFPEADSAFVSGSIIRGEGKKHSDLDIVVLFSKLPNAFRESFVFEFTPIEAFVHDPETIHWFVDDEKKKGINILAHMISTGIILPKETGLSRQIVDYSNSVLLRGPDSISKEALYKLRYFITDLLDDLRDSRPHQEKIACAVQLYPLLAEAVLRNAGQWLANGKWVSRKLKIADPKLAKRFESAFNDVFVGGDAAKLIKLSEEILEPVGGFYWEGWHVNAPKKWRKKFD